MRKMRRRSSDQHALLASFVVTTICCWANAFTTTVLSSRTTNNLFGLVKAPSRRHATTLIEAEGTNGLGEEVSANGVVSGQPSALQSGHISPYHILYPEMLSSTSGPLEKALPLDGCLRLLRKAMNTVLDESNDLFSDPSSAPAILRIEHKISHVVDPLCWLQAQNKRNRRYDHPSIYFATAEGTIEAAAFGSSETYSGTVQDDAYWRLLEDLPSSAHMYGGQRFDVDSPTSDEWQSFSNGFWMLPAVELRTSRQSEESGKARSSMSTTISVHLFNQDGRGFLDSARHVLDILSVLTDASTPMVPPTTLPPILSRTSTYDTNVDGQEIYEKAVMAALEEFELPDSHLEKVVLARRMDLSFARHAADNVDPLDILRKWKFASKPGGHMFYIHPGGSNSGEFFGCTPERLFRVHHKAVLSEALAGTRPRGSTQESDELLSRQLFASAKDQAENLITGNFIRDTILEMENRGLLVTDQDVNGTRTIGGNFFVRRLRHLQHICQRYECTIPEHVENLKAIQSLLLALHPTPAVGGFPQRAAMDFIRLHETIGFDRGFYAGPVGFIGKDSAEIVVAIRSGLLSRSGARPKLSVYGGAGIVPGSTVQGEWAETSYKLAVVSSIFPQSPITLQSAPTPNAAWATAFIEELIRNGVTHFYICPGSRSTPLVAAIAKAVRSNVGVVHALSVHDERGAGFRAVGYGRGSGQPAVVVTSSGTAVANLYPAVIEASMEGIPMLIVTADRPYENRDTGANQAIDQVKVFSSSYIRWFRDVHPPSNDVPVAVALADATHGVSTSRKLSGPVHLNVQFRENLAPDAGHIRNDDRAAAMTCYDAMLFTETPGFQKWSLGGDRWLRSYSNEGAISLSAVSDIATLISQSKRGIIVVGNMRKPGTDAESEDASQVVQMLSTLAHTIGFPIFASALSGALRFESASVVLFAEHVLRCSSIQDNLKPDLIVQFGTPLISTELSKVIRKTMTEEPIYHILVHPHQTSERADPDFTLTHKIDAEIGAFASELTSYIDKSQDCCAGSSLASLVNVGKVMQTQMPDIVKSAAENMRRDNSDDKTLSEPEVMMVLAKTLGRADTPDLSLFLSNSMPIRDAEAFLYPVDGLNSALRETGVNRGASGIDGIIASASGFADATDRPTTLVIGDVAALHDINSLHTLRTSMAVKETQTQKAQPLTAIILNNDGGGIFSFLPIASHGSDVAFEDFFGTPTNSFSFKKASEAFDLKYKKAQDADTFEDMYKSALASGVTSLIEAIVSPRDQNVLVHKEITRLSNKILEEAIAGCNTTVNELEVLPLKRYRLEWDAHPSEDADKQKTLVLLHGWMGDKAEWDEAGINLAEQLPHTWDIISLDLPGHGDSDLHHSSPIQSARNALGLNDDEEAVDPSDLTVDRMARCVLHTLAAEGVKEIDAIAGYSLGGRVALAMKRMSLVTKDENHTNSLMNRETELILLSTYPGELRPTESSFAVHNSRLKADDSRSSEIAMLSDQAMLQNCSKENSILIWSNFLTKWYGAPMWGSLNRSSKTFEALVSKRSAALSRRGHDLAQVLKQCSPPRCRRDDWRGVEPEKTLFISGASDTKYSDIATEWALVSPRLNVHSIANKGHALLTESPKEVASIVSDFILTEVKFDRQIDREKETIFESTKNASFVLEDALLKKSTGKDYAGSHPESAWLTSVASLDFEIFSINFEDESSGKPGISGIGWGENADAQKVTEQRTGLIIQVLSSDGSHVGVGEVSPLSGLHSETFAEAEEQLHEIAGKISEVGLKRAPTFDARKVLAADGSILEYLNHLKEILSIDTLLNSVRSGLEMAIISLASQVVRVPIHQALAENSPPEYRCVRQGALLPLNGLITRGSVPAQIAAGKISQRPDYESWKVKVGHQSPYDDALAISYAYQVSQVSQVSKSRHTDGKIRADANRSFNVTNAIRFASILKEIDIDALKRLEYVEEPLQRYSSESGHWSFAEQIGALNDWQNATGIPYALDESVSDLAHLHSYSFDLISSDLKGALWDQKGSCAALVLKPSLLGLELSIQLARFSRKELEIGAVFTSSFDSGVGLAFASFLGSLSDSSPAGPQVKTFSHGLGTFSMLADDCISPSFGSYVSSEGKLNVMSLSRAFYGLGLDEIRCLSIDPLPSPQLPSPTLATRGIEDNGFQFSGFEASDDFEASTATSSDGREINVLASLPLPFSAEIACSRFTDLPQQPRWSPWISSVAYIDAQSETEWTLRVRGVNFRWRATSSLLEKPDRGIRWESVGGLKNAGAVEFIPFDGDTCVMKVQIAFVTPRILAPLFRGTAMFFEDFLRNKILKWSLEMFRDVVKGDLALEEGNIELGDALFGAVEGKATAIEATLSSPMDKEI